MSSVGRLVPACRNCRHWGLKPKSRAAWNTCHLLSFKWDRDFLFVDGEVVNGGKNVNGAYIHVVGYDWDSADLETRRTFSCSDHQPWPEET